MRGCMVLAFNSINFLFNSVIATQMVYLLKEITGTNGSTTSNNEIHVYFFPYAYLKI